MRIYLYSIYREGDPHSRIGYFDTIRELAAIDSIGKHELVSNIAESDCCLITEVQSHLDDWRFSRFRRSDFVRQWGHKTFIYCDADRPLYLLPGLYPSVTRSLGDPDHQHSFCYLGIPEFEGDLIFGQTEPDLLFSFSGQLQNHACRRQIGALKSDSAEIIDTSGTYIFGADPETVRQMKERYRRQLARSKFVLCPRGVGTSSYRLFETMAAGRVPVIISDDWVEPAGPAWEQFSIRVAERDVLDIPRLLKERENAFQEMATRCRAEFSSRFGRRSMFNYLGDCLERLQENPVKRRI
ncbi:MAG: hypothetical protein JWP03_4290, partial [Phycisphaerales bacterium]|nr:hypothetical protein [Phycisphaerales bacterium]